MVCTSQNSGDHGYHICILGLNMLFSPWFPTTSEVSPGEGDEDEAGSEWPLQALFAEFSSSGMEDTWKTWDNLWKRCGKLW